MLVAVVYSLPVEHFVVLLLAAAWKAGVLACERNALAWVSAPSGLSAPMTPRALRLLRQSQISAW